MYSVDLFCYNYLNSYFQTKTFWILGFHLAFSPSQYLVGPLRYFFHWSCSQCTAQSISGSYRNLILSISDCWSEGILSRRIVGNGSWHLILLGSQNGHVGHSVNGTVAFQRGNYLNGFAYVCKLKILTFFQMIKKKLNTT